MAEIHNKLIGIGDKPMWKKIDGEIIKQVEVTEDYALLSHADTGAPDPKDGFFEIKGKSPCPPEHPLDGELPFE